MTDQAKTGARKPRNGGAVFFCIVSLFFLILIVKNSQIAISYMKRGLRLCAATVIPSLFPFMVLSEILTASGFGERISRRIGGPLRFLLGISPAGASALLLGVFCGFPIGTKTAVTLYDRGEISKSEVERLITFCNVPSTGFLVGAVGVSLYGNKNFGIFLFLSALFSSLITGVFLRFRSLPLSHLPQRQVKRMSLRLSCFSDAIASATSSILSVCACVVFFTAVIGCLSHTLSALHLPAFGDALLFGIFEISSGTVASSALSSLSVSAAITGFCIGWSGLSVHFQILSLVRDRGISLRPYFIAKLSQGCLCAFLSWGYVVLIKPPLSPSMQATETILLTDTQIRHATVWCVLFLIALLVSRKRALFTAP